MRQIPGAIISLFLVLCAVLLPSAAEAMKASARHLDQSKLKPAQEESEPVVELAIPGSYRVRKVAMFPLELPGYVIEGVLWPFAKGLDALERKRIFKRGADLMSNKEKTLWVYPVIDWSTGVSFGGGPALKYLDLFDKRYTLEAYYKIHVDMSQYAGFLIKKKDAIELFERPLSFQGGLKWIRQRRDDYYGIGMTPQSDHAKFDDTVIDADSRFDLDLGRHFSMEGDFAFTTSTTGPTAKGGYPSVNQMFPPSGIPGFERWITYFRFGAAIIQDTRDNADFPTHGGRRALSFYRYQEISGSDYSFNEYDLDVSQYLPLWKPGMVLVLHNGWKFQQAIGGDMVPFNRLAVLDYKNMLRGFKRGRFHDVSSVVFNVDYIYPVSRMVRGRVFFDAGRVFHGVQDFSFSNFKYDGGGGIEMHLFKVMLFKFMAAYGGEGVNLMLSIGQEF